MEAFKMELKRTIFYIFETTRQLFNNYYNGHGNNFTDEELNEILNKITELEEQLKELKEAHYDETFKNGLPF